MSWNYRIVHYRNEGYGLHEVYDDAGKPISMTRNPTTFVSWDEEGRQGIISALELALVLAAQRRTRVI